MPASVRHRPDSASGRLCLAAGEPPDPVPLGRELQASGGRAAAARRPGRPQLQARGQPFPRKPALHQRSRFVPAPPLAVVAGSARTPRTGTAPSQLGTASHTRPRPSAPRQRPRRSRPRAPDPAQTPEPGPYVRSAENRGRRMPHNGFERVGPCPDTREIGRCGRCAAGVGAGPRAVLRYATNVPRAPAHPWPSRPERQPVNRLARGSKSPAGSGRSGHERGCRRAACRKERAVS